MESNPQHVNGTQVVLHYLKKVVPCQSELMISTQKGLVQWTYTGSRLLLCLHSFNAKRLVPETVESMTAKKKT